jgi:hypothetical protein
VTDLSGRADAFRALRAQAEASVLPLTTSLDGRRLSFQARIEGLDLKLGGYLMLEGGGGAALGQVRPPPSPTTSSRAPDQRHAADRSD